METKPPYEKSRSRQTSFSPGLQLNYKATTLINDVNTVDTSTLTTGFSPPISTTETKTLYFIIAGLTIFSLVLAVGFFIKKPRVQRRRHRNKLHADLEYNNYNSNLGNGSERERDILSSPTGFVTLDAQEDFEFRAFSGRHYYNCNNLEYIKAEGSNSNSQEYIEFLEFSEGNYYNCNNFEYINTGDSNIDRVSTNNAQKRHTSPQSLSRSAPSFEIAGVFGRGNLNIETVSTDRLGCKETAGSYENVFKEMYSRHERNVYEVPGQSVYENVAEEDEGEYRQLEQEYLF